MPTSQGVKSGVYIWMMTGAGRYPGIYETSRTVHSPRHKQRKYLTLTLPDILGLGLCPPHYSRTRL